jgi:hypothetical protein
MKSPTFDEKAASLEAQLLAIVAPGKAVRAGAPAPGADDALAIGVAQAMREQCAARRDEAVMQAIADAKTSIERHTTLKLLELRIAYEKANSDMLLRLGGVILCILTIAIASARFLGIVY